MPVTIDGPNKLFIADAGTTEINLVTDLYSPYKDWVLAGNTQFLPAFAEMPPANPGVSTTRVVGGDDIDTGAGTSIPSYFFLTNGWRIRPQEADHTLAISAAIVLVDGGGDPFVDTLGAFTVRINYQQPVQAIGVATGAGGGLTADEVWEAIPAALADGDLPDLPAGAFPNENAASILLRALIHSLNASRGFRP